MREEQAKAEGQRRSLAMALEAKRGPLQQAKERYALRRARPCRETVQDEVEAALAKEIAHLNSVTKQLADKMNSVDKELGQLDVTAAMIEDNIRDKDSAINLDERMVLLDGRLNVPTAPPSSVASVSPGCAPMGGTYVLVGWLSVGVVSCATVIGIFWILQPTA